MDGNHNRQRSSYELGKRLKATLDMMFGDDYYMTRNGKIVTDWHLHLEKHDGILRLNYRIIGGKGGFGSMLRALGAQIEKTTNREACRDLSGRRMRDVNNEKKITDWLNKQVEKEAEKKKRKQEKFERILNPPKHFMDNQSYVHSIQETAEEIDDALRKGVHAAPSAEFSYHDARSDVPEAIVSLSQHGRNEQKSGRKRKAEGDNSPKRSKAWFGVDEDDSDENEHGCDTVLPQYTEGIASPVDNCESNKSKEQSESSEQILNGSHNNNCSNSNETAEQTKSQNGSKVSDEEVPVDEHTVAASEINERDSSQVVPTKTADKRSTEPTKSEPIALEKYETIEELESLGLDRLKHGLVALGLKCGGTLTQRAERLFLVKKTPLDQLDRSLFAKTNGKGAKKAKNK